MKSFADAHLQGLPMVLINFVTRIVIGRFWVSLLQVAEDVRDGQRPQFIEAVAGNRELYDWAENRIDVMIEKVKAASVPNTEEETKEVMT
jgi:Ethanolamine utilization protein EutJ (predicted chaperonin)